MTLQELQFTPHEASFITGLAHREIQKAFDQGWFEARPRRRIKGMAARRLGLAELVHLRVLEDTGHQVVWRAEAKRMLHRELRERTPRLVLAESDAVWAIDVRPRPHDFSIWLQTDAGALELEGSLARVPSGRASFGRLVEERPCRAVSIVGVFVPRKGGLVPWAWQRSLERVGKMLQDPVRLDHLLLEVGTSWAGIAERFADAVAARLAVIADPDIRSGETVVRGTRIPVRLLQELARQGAAAQELLADYPSLDETTLRLALLYADTHPRSGRPVEKPWHRPAAE